MSRDVLHPLILSMVLILHNICIYSRFMSRGVLHPLILSMVLMFLQSWSGMNVLVFKVGFTLIDVCIRKRESNTIIYSEQGRTRAFF